MTGATSRQVLVIRHGSRPDARRAADEAARLLVDAGVEVLCPPADAAGLTIPAHLLTIVSTDTSDVTPELVVVLGGDGTILRGAELARPAGIPLLGVNLGHVGFLAEAERDAVADTVARVVARDYAVEERMTIDVRVLVDGRPFATAWALNEASVEKPVREKMLDLLLEIDGRPLSRWGADGVVLATPTGSTAYAFSAGGPVVWPTVEAMLVVPLSAHALFARPLVIAPTSVIVVELIGKPGVLWCDGRRSIDVPAGARIEVRRGMQPVRLARLHPAPFTDRLVAKFALPVEGWRGPR
jgi:NAD+ kinase